MNGPPHTASEIAEYIKRATAQLVKLGVDRERAITVVAINYGVERDRIEPLVGDLPGETTREPEVAV